MSSRLDRPTVHIPSLDGATGWLNSEPLTPEGLRGSVVLVDFWTYTCINWLRTLPYIRAWGEKYKEHGLVVLGVHTPEFPFEHDFGNVREQVKAMRIDYPVAADNDYAVWNAFSNNYWPALYLVDQDGAFRYEHFGEGRYAESEEAIQELLGVDDELVSVVGSDLEAPADWDDLQTPETYVGYARGERFASGGAAGGERRAYAIPESLGPNRWALEGEWTIRQSAAESHEAGAAIAFRFHARDLHVVLAPATRGQPVRFRVTIDGQPPGSSHGSDTDEQGEGAIVDPRLYQLIRQSGSVRDRTFEMTFLDPGAQVYAFTFG
jgi:thiol-disulfide isomerase/thioredoxin